MAGRLAIDQAGLQIFIGSFLILPDFYPASNLKSGKDENVIN
jgi:hypothetical protein